MKPSVFIGSSSEALPLAEAIQRELSGDYRAELWNQHLFELGEDTLNNLLRFVQCYDFAVLVLTGDDFTKSRGAESKSPRDNLIFELGLFMGALGRRRAFPIVAPGKNTAVKLPSDLLGNNAVFLPKGFAKKPTPAALRQALAQLLKTLQTRSQESSLQQLPSTALAIGYFQNFVLPVCRELANSKTVLAQGKEIDISRGNYDFSIVLPATLTDASIEGAKKFCKVQNVSEFSLKTGARSYPFYVASALKAGRLAFYDYPTTLRASLECIHLVLSGPYIANTRYHQMLDEREINNFERTLGHLLDHPDAANVRDKVKIIHAG